MSTPDPLDAWIEMACVELGVDPGDEYTKTILNLTRVIAHKVDRRGAPLTSYLLGLAVGSGQPLADAAARLQDIARNWPDPPEE
ncbi:MAG TPA: DUF6457 domain-containing protein [Streptosporangiaceae bacterium]